MKLTPLDIHHKEFHHALRGYSEDEVDTFLDEVADEFERLFKENIDLSEKLEAASSKVREYQSMEITLNNTMVSAQRSAENIVGQANEDATTVLRDAEVKAKEIIHSALTDKQRVQGELVRIKQAEEDFRARFRGLLEQHLRELSEISLPADVNVMMGTTENGVVADVDVRPELFAALAMADETTESSDSEQLLADTGFAADPMDAEQDAPPESATAATGFVTSVGLGEIVPPELPDEEPSFGDPLEFSVPSFDAFGEREDDVDIEEID